MDKAVPPVIVDKDYDDIRYLMQTKGWLQCCEHLSTSIANINWRRLRIMLVIHRLGQ